MHWSNRVWILTVLGIVTIAAVCHCNTLENSIAKTSIELYQIFKKHGNNLIFSPLSIDIVLAMTYLGARGATAKEIENAFHLPERKETLTGYLQIVKQLMGSGVKSATKLYFDINTHIKHIFKEETKKYFLSETGTVSFADSVNTASEINKWVASETDNKIQDLISPGSIDIDTHLVLLSAILLKNNWTTPFNTQMTKTAKFHKSKNDIVDVKMMNRRGRFSYSQNDLLGAQVLSIPNVNNIDMVIVLPNKVDGLETVENNLSKIGWKDALISMKSREVIVFLPKFKIESTFDTLKDALKKLGIHRLFNGEAELSGISESALYVSSVIQKAFFEVNEKGTEAAAATAAIYAYRSRGPIKIDNPVPPVIFRADHPFLFILKRKDLIIFQGRYVKP